jgi:prepilin-type N-terminal cleavage/methylation domain-containing protein
MKFPARDHFPLNRRAFTLIELLVVVAIIAVLIAILVPVVSRVRETSNAAKCANNMRQVSQATRQFANEYDGRGPAEGNASATSSVSWHEILDAEVFARPGSQYGVVRLTNPANIKDPTVVKTLSCPKWVVRTAIRVYAMNEYVGGFIGRPNRIPDDPKLHIAGYYGPHASLTTPPSGKKMGDAYSYFDFGGAGAKYHLGTKLSRFGPSQILLVEHDWGNDWFRGYDTPVIFNRDGTPPEPTGPGYADWISSTKSGDLVFRHPYYGKANFARFDGSVEMAGKNDGAQLIKRYAPE